MKVNNKEWLIPMAPGVLGSQVASAQGVHESQVAGAHVVDAKALETQVVDTDDQCDQGLGAKVYVNYGLGGQVLGSKDLGSKSSYSEVLDSQSLDHR